MVSMTGFAFGETSVGSVRMTIELKSYNNRYLDLILGLPASLASWEPVLRDKLASAIGRGRVECNVRLKEQVEGVSIEVNLPLARDYCAALEVLRKGAGLKDKVRLDQVAAFPGVLGASKDQDPVALRKAADTLVGTLLDEFQKSRQAEGARLQSDILRQLETITSGRSAVAGRSETMEGVFRDNLRRKFQDLAAEADENRILSETALLLVRYGINEELVRLESHEKTFRELASESGPVGKKLDFLCQELGREINTIGSKTTFAEVQQLVVSMKDALENIREQLRNVE